MLVAKLIVIGLVTFFIYRVVQKSQNEFLESEFRIADIRWRWLIVASISYTLGMLPMGWNWHRLLCAMQQHVPRWEAMRTHFISQLGKYVPGKACVPAIRLGLLARHQLHAPTALVSMAAETLAMMSVGAVIGAAVIAALYRSHPQVALTAVGLALVSGLPVIPPVLRVAIRFLEQRRAKKLGEAPMNVEQHLTWRVVVVGWLAIGPGWMLLGLSMWAAMKSLNLPTTQEMSITELPWITASYAVSVVAGFASMLPGGVLVREWVIQELIAPKYGAVAALLAAVVHRMTSLVSELVVSSMLYLYYRLRDCPPAKAHAPDR